MFSLNFNQWIMVFMLITSNLSMIFGVFFLINSLEIDNEIASWQSYFMIVLGALGVVVFSRFYEKLFVLK